MRLTKHHGLGNDFLVLLDADGSSPVTPGQVRALCDRRRGVGADGLIRATRPAGAGVGGADGVAAGDRGPHAVMALTNADGSPAEMSGNGIRCLAQALLTAGWAPGPEVVIDTPAGRRTVTEYDAVDDVTQDFSVDMGPARLVGAAPEWAGGPFARAVAVDTGNPHVVVELAPEAAAAATHDAAGISLVELGEQVNAKVPGGANVHLLARDAELGSGVVVRTYERGVGPTAACGTGACASAAAAHAWGLVGEVVAVRMPGGTAHVTLGETVVLRGPATYVATVEVPNPVAPPRR
jgi:diaminopimelate epimerase